MRCIDSANRISTRRELRLGAPPELAFACDLVRSDQIGTRGDAMKPRTHNAKVEVGGSTREKRGPMRGVASMS